MRGTNLTKREKIKDLSKTFFLSALICGYFPCHFFARLLQRQSLMIEDVMRGKSGAIRRRRRRRRRRRNYLLALIQSLRTSAYCLLILPTWISRGVREMTRDYCSYIFARAIVIVQSKHSDVRQGKKFPRSISGGENAWRQFFPENPILQFMVDWVCFRFFSRNHFFCFPLRSTDCERQGKL